MEETREILNQTINKYGLRSIEALRASKEMDKYINKSVKVERRKNKT